MITLKQVLDKKDRVIELAKLFGFGDEVKIYYTAPDKDKNFTLYFIVKETEKLLSYKNHSWLSAKLTAELGCLTNAIVYESIDDLYHYDYDKKSASIHDTEAISTLFKQAPLDSIKLVEIGDDEEDKVIQELCLKKADEYLKKESAENPLSPSSKGYARYSLVSSPEKKRQQDSDDNTESSIKADEIEKFLSDENKDVAKETLQDLPKHVLSEVLSVFNSKRHQQEQVAGKANDSKRHKGDKGNEPSAQNDGTQTILVK